MECYKRGEVAIALEAINVILKDQPDQLDALVLAGQIQHGQGNHEKAVFYLEKALSQVPGHVALRQTVFRSVDATTVPRSYRPCKKRG